LIAWGGVAAQAVIGVPLVLWIIFFGYTRFEAVNAVLAILGGYSLCVAAFNLLPIPGLDGSIAWGIIPEWLRRRRTKATRPKWNR
jgi:Zn-dependent protease